MKKTRRLEMSRWPLSVDMFLRQRYLICNQLAKKTLNLSFQIKEKDKMPLRRNHILELLPSVTSLYGQAEEIMHINVSVIEVVIN